MQLRKLQSAVTKQWRLAICQEISLLERCLSPKCEFPFTYLSAQRWSLLSHVIKWLRCITLTKKELWLFSSIPSLHSFKLALPTNDILCNIWKAEVKYSLFIFFMLWSLGHVAGYRPNDSSYTLSGIRWLTQVMCSSTWSHSFSSSCWICSFNFSVFGQVHAWFLGERHHLLFPVIQSLWDWKWNPYIHLTSFCSCIQLFSWVSGSFSLVYFKLFSPTADLTDNFNSNTGCWGKSLQGPIYQLPQLCEA